MKAIFTYDYGQENMQKLRDLGVEIVYSPEDEFEYRPEMDGAEAIVCFNPFNKVDFSKMDSMKWIQLVSKGVNHVPENLRNCGKIITNNTQTTSIPIGEWIVTYILNAFKMIKTFYGHQSRHEWIQEHEVKEICGKTIGILGTGNIAREAAKRLKAFDATIIGVNTTGKPKEFFDEVYSFDTMEPFWGRCDVIVSTLPSTDRTYHIINADTIAKMKDGVTLVNISRGSIIDTEAMLQANAQGKFYAIALDVYEKEPLPDDSPIWSAENILATPHTVMWSENYFERCFETVYANFAKYVKGEPLNDVVDFAKGY